MIRHIEKYVEKDSASCLSGPIERPRYRARQLVTAGDLTLEQDYFREKQRLHNRMLHGWGVVCGALVCTVPKTQGDGDEPWQVRVQPGYALGPWGDEIVIDCERVVDLRTPGTGGAAGEPPEQSRDPWCSEVHLPRRKGPVYVAVRYKEIPTRPVRSQPLGCGCSGTECEYSRFRDGYEIGILPECPDSHEDPPGRADFFLGPNPDCPPCPAEPWVVLAEVTVGDNGSIDKIDNCACRRLVVSFANTWWRCSEQPDAKPGRPQPEPGKEEPVVETKPVKESAEEDAGKPSGRKPPTKGTKPEK